MLHLAHATLNLALDAVVTIHSEEVDVGQWPQHLWIQSPTVDFIANSAWKVAYDQC